MISDIVGKIKSRCDRRRLFMRPICYHPELGAAMVTYYAIIVPDPQKGSREVLHRDDRRLRLLPRPWLTPARLLLWSKPTDDFTTFC